MKKLLLLIPALLFMACGSASEKTSMDENAEVVVIDAHQSASIKKVLTAHGGFSNWRSMQQLSFDMGDQKHLISLSNRNVLVKGADWQMGNDGGNVWISPVENSYKGDPRFYNNLYFYFFAMPFVLGDEGIIYEDLPDRNIKGVDYHVVKIAYQDGIGDSSKDNYLLFYDKETNEMAWLMYTVTFRSQAVSERFNLIKYEGWENHEGVVLPSKLVWYEFKDDIVGNPRREVPFENIVINKELPDNALFVMPAEGKIVPKPSSSN